MYYRRYGVMLEEGKWTECTYMWFICWPRWGWIKKLNGTWWQEKKVWNIDKTVWLNNAIKLSEFKIYFLISVHDYGHITFYLAAKECSL